MTDPAPNGSFRGTALQILLLEDSKFDAELVRGCLLPAYPLAVLEVVGDEESFVDRLVRGGLDIILSDYRLPGFTGAQALQLAYSATPDTPFIFVSGLIGEDNAVEMLRQGATDYVSKGRLARLPVVMERALREAAERQARGLAETRLREADTLFARVVDSLRDYAVILLDAEGAIKTWNRAAPQVFGYPPGSPVVASTAALFTAADQAAGVFADDLRTALANGMANADRWMMRGDGAQFWAEGVLTPLYDDVGKHSGFSKIVRDATIAHRGAEQLRVAKDAAEHANDAKNRFLAVLSHELRTPLAPIASAAYVLERHATVPEALKGLLPMIKRNVALEARLIDDLLDLTFISAGKTNLKREVVDMHVLMRNVAEMIELDVLAKTLDFRLELAAADPFVDADPVRMQQVLWNVVRNAVKFTPEAGTVVIRSESGGGEFVWSCSDTGIGIAADALPRIFTAFEQADAEITRQFGGLGLSLAIAAGLVEEHAGRLTAASAGPGQGATFTLTLPSAGAAGAAVLLPAAAALPSAVVPRRFQPAGDVCRLLLVEDNVDAADTMVMALESYGYRVSHAPTLAAALEVLGTLSFDIVVTDLGLPDGDGIDVGRALRGSTPVIALSGYGTTQDVQQSMRAGFARHLVKPVDPAVVHATVQKILAERLLRPAL